MRRHPDAAAMLLHDGISDGESQARAFAHLFRRKKRIENFRLNFRRDARPIVADLEHD